LAFDMSTAKDIGAMSEAGSDSPLSTPDRDLLIGVSFSLQPIYVQTCFLNRIHVCMVIALASGTAVF
jgi:hypothetical protein